MQARPVCLSFVKHAKAPDIRIQPVFLSLFQAESKKPFKME
jgi:hypothetical protein